MAKKDNKTFNVLVVIAVLVGVTAFSTFYLTFFNSDKSSGFSGDELTGYVTYGQNVALNKPASSNSCYGNCCGPTCSYGASKTVDGNLGTRWASKRNNPKIGPSTPHWVAVDLGQAYNIGKANLALHGSLTQNYNLQYSINNVNWLTVTSKTGAVGNQEHTFSPTQARYWRVAVTYSADKEQANVYDLKLFNVLNDTIICNTNADCGTDAYTGNYYCQSDDVYRNYLTNTCVNPGTTSSYCTTGTSSNIIDDCASNEYCVNGQSSCHQQTSYCGNGICNVGENVNTCSSDCSNDVYYTNVANENGLVTVTFGINTNYLVSYGIKLNFDSSRFSLDHQKLTSMLCAFNNTNGKVGCATWPAITGGNVSKYTLTQVSETGSTLGSLYIEEVNGAQPKKYINLSFAA